MNIIMEIQYMGEAYSGWQRQSNASSIQQKIEEAIYKVTGQYADVIGSGRTDSGVHALAQVANVKVKTKIPPERIKHALNYYLPKDIRIMKTARCSDEFHARFDAKRKTYRYRINVNSVESPFERGRAYFVGRELDCSTMKEMAEQFVGEHDFSAFRSEGSSSKSTVRTVYDCEVNREGDIISIRITGNGFLYNMVRIIAGTLVEVGKGKKFPIEQLFESGDRSKAGHTAPALGLFLEKVYYDIDIDGSKW